jgi:hypothetical protein
MPKIVTCKNCNKSFLGGTYMLIHHYDKCVKQTSPPSIDHGIDNRPAPRPRISDSTDH